MTEHTINQLSDSRNQKNRRRIGVTVGILSISLNLMLAVLKLTAGAWADSIAVTADGLNNFADAGICILALLGLRLGSMKPSARYPMGYGRLEYLSGTAIAVSILLIGVRMLTSSAEKILHPKPIECSTVTIAVLMASIAVKSCMYIYNNKVGRLICSTGMRAAALDALSDCFATLAILLSALLETFTGLRTDGYTGVLVALCILWAGFAALRESIGPLLGHGADAKTTDQINSILQSYGISGCERLILHDYGPNKKLLTISAAADTAMIPYIRKAIFEQTGLDAYLCPCREVNKSGSDCQEYYRKSDINRSVNNVNIKRGDIYYADLSPVVGSEQGGIRPVLIIQNDIGNRYSPTVIAAAITSKQSKNKLPTHIPIEAGDCGLQKDSVVLLEQVRTLDKRRLKEKMGSVDYQSMKAINQALSVSFGLIG